MRRVFRLTLLLGLVGGVVAAVRKALGPKEVPVQEVHGSAGPAAENLPAGQTYTSGSSDTPAPLAGSVEAKPPETEAPESPKPESE